MLLVLGALFLRIPKDHMTDIVCMGTRADKRRSKLCLQALFRTQLAVALRRQAHR